MGFNIGKAFTRAVGIPDKYRPIVTAVAVPFVGPTQLAIAGGQKILSSVSASHAPSQGTTQLHDQGIPQPPIYNIPQPAGPTYTYYAGGGGYDPYGGGAQPWESLTPSTTYFQPQSQMYPAYSPAPPQRQDRIWEDLIQASLLFL